MAFDPVIDEIVRCKSREGIRPEVFRRWQQYLRDVVDPKLVQLAELEAEPPAQKRSGKAVA